jgi:hypothetical protein
VVTETNPCEPGETTITFNAPGPRGPTGANGTNGRDGTAGTSCANRSDSLCRGPDASASYSPAQATTTVYRGDHVSIKRDSSESATASCVESESRLSGGYELSDIDSKSTRPLLSIKENMPFGQRGWSVAVRNSSLEKVKLTVFAICGKGN